jgi:hypothetical protein
MKCYTDLKGKDNSEDLGADGWIILNWIIGKLVMGCGVDLYVQDRDRWLGLVNTVMNLGVP